MVSKIVIYPHYCQILDEEDSSFLKELDKELSYFNESAVFSKAFKIKRWDGMTHLLKGNLTFASGFLDRVSNLYKSFNKEFEIVDLRSSKLNNSPIEINQKLVDIGKVPFYYQNEMVDVAAKKDRGILEPPQVQEKV